MNVQSLKLNLGEGVVDESRESSSSSLLQLHFVTSSYFLSYVKKKNSL